MHFNCSKYHEGSSRNFHPVTKNSADTALQIYIKSERMKEARQNHPFLILETYQKHETSLAYLFSNLADTGAAMFSRCYDSSRKSNNRNYQAKSERAQNHARYICWLPSTQNRKYCSLSEMSAGITGSQHLI